MELTAKTNKNTKIVKTEGYWIYDEYDNKQLDISCGSFAYTLGYGNKEIIDEMSSSLSQVTRAHLPIGHTTDDIEEMKNLLLSSGNWAGVIWSLTGTGAVESAIHIGQTYFKIKGTPKDRVITFGKGWHGTSAITKKYSGMWPLTKYDNNVSLSTPAWQTQEERIEQEAQTLSDIRNELNNSNDIGQILINPNPWFNGVNPWSKNFWLELDSIRNEYDILIVTDDIASCWGKAKTYHSFSTMFPEGMQPDISCVGKAITAGYAPLAAAVATKKIADVVQGKVNYQHTFQPYLGGISAMKAVNRIIVRENLFEKTNWIETQINRIGEILKEKEQIESYTAYGTCGAFYLKDREIGKDLKGMYYGLSSDLSKIPNLRMCIPLISDDEYFYEFEKMLKQKLN